MELYFEEPIKVGWMGVFPAPIRWICTSLLPFWELMEKRAVVVWSALARSISVADWSKGEGRNVRTWKAFVLWAGGRDWLLEEPVLNSREREKELILR